MSTEKIEPGQVTFVGAGPGDPDLLTIGGKKAIEEAELILYAGSLVSPAILEFASQSAQIYDSSSLSLAQTHALLKENAYEGKKAARVHTGDPSIYGALAEQIELLNQDGIPWKIIPGVTAATAAAAKAGISFSLPEVSQSLIITRIGGRTPMPDNESLEKLAANKTAMAIYLAGHKYMEVYNKLSAVLPDATPIICASRIGWPEECVFSATLGTLCDLARKYKIGRQTMLLILPGNTRKCGRSKLYTEDFSHTFRPKIQI